jgi:hypothetical protein
MSADSWTGLGMAAAQNMGLFDQLSYGLGQLTGYNKSMEKRQIRQQQALMNQQIAGNKELATHSDQLQRATWDYTSSNNMKNEMKQIKEMGLNPALMYSGGAGGGGGATTGSASAGQASSGQAANAAEMMRTMKNPGMGMELAMMKSNIELNEAQAAKLRAEAENKAGVEREGVGLDNSIKELEITLKKGSIEANIKTIQKNLEKITSEAEIMKNNAKISTETKEAKIKEAVLINKKTAAEIIKTQSDTHLSNEQAIAIVEQLQQGWQRLSMEEKNNIRNNNTNLRITEKNNETTISAVDKNNKTSKEIANYEGAVRQGTAYLELGKSATGTMWKIAEGISSLWNGQQKPVEQIKIK